MCGFTALLPWALTPVASAEVARAKGGKATAAERTLLTTAKVEQFELHWQAPSGCPAAEEVAAAVAHLLGAGVPAGARALLVQGSMASVAGGAELRLELRGGTELSHRQLSARTCEELADAAALVIALAINPELASAAPTSSVSPGARECPVQSPPECPAPPVCETPPPPTRCPIVTAAPEGPTTLSSIAAGPAFRGAAGVRVTLGALPQAFPSPTVSAAYVASPGRLELSAGMAWASRASSGGASVATFQLWKLTPRGCLAESLGSVALDYCAGVETGLLRAEGFGTDTVHTRWSAWVSPLLAVDVEFPRVAPGLFMDFQVAAALVRDRFGLAGTPVFRPSLILPSVGLFGSFGVL